MSMSAGDVMNYAGGLTSAIGGGDKSDSSKSAGSGTNDSAKSSDTGDSGNGKADSPNTQQKTAETRYLIVIPTV